MMISCPEICCKISLRHAEWVSRQGKRARSLGLSLYLTMRLVSLPQAARNLIPFFTVGINKQEVQNLHGIAQVYEPLFYCNSLQFNNLFTMFSYDIIMGNNYNCLTLSVKSSKHVYNKISIDCIQRACWLIC